MTKWEEKLSHSPEDYAKTSDACVRLNVHRVRFFACLDALKSTQAWP